jgi:hypothetical protein
MSIDRLTLLPPFSQHALLQNRKPGTTDLSQYDLREQMQLEVLRRPAELALIDVRNRGLKDVFFFVCDGLKGLPDAIAATGPLAIAQTSSIDTGWRRDGLAGHRATGRGPMQTRAFEALMQTCPSWWRRVA